MQKSLAETVPDPLRKLVVQATRCLSDTSQVGLSMNQRFASCACGRLQVDCRGAPSRISMCHCVDCQRRTGSAFGIAAFFDRGEVSVVQGASKTYTRESASGKQVTFHFCPECGSTIFW